MVPDASPPVEDSDGDDDGSNGDDDSSEGDAGPAPAAASSMRVLVLTCIQRTVKAALADPAPLAVKGSLESTVALLGVVLTRLVDARFLLPMAVGDEGREHAPVYLRCAGRAADWRHRAVLLTMRGPWLPRCVQGDRPCGVLSALAFRLGPRQVRRRTSVVVVHGLTVL
jgi:hypothetical protein